MKKIVLFLNKSLFIIFVAMNISPAQAGWWEWTKSMIGLASSRQDIIADIEEEDVATPVVQPAPFVVQQAPQNLYPVVDANDGEEDLPPVLHVAPLLQANFMHQEDTQDTLNMVLEILNDNFNPEINRINAGGHDVKQIRQKLKEKLYDLIHDQQIAEQALNQLCPPVQRPLVQWQHQVQPLQVQNQPQHVPIVINQVDQDVDTKLVKFIKDNFSEAIKTINNDQENGGFYKESLVENLIDMGYTDVSIERALQSLIKPKVIAKKLIIEPQVLKASVKAQIEKRECCVCTEEHEGVFEIPCLGGYHNSEDGLCKDCFNNINNIAAGGARNCPLCQNCFDNNKVQALKNKNFL